MWRRFRAIDSSRRSRGFLWLRDILVDIGRLIIETSDQFAELAIRSVKERTLSHHPYRRSLNSLAWFTLVSIEGSAVRARSIPLAALNKRSFFNGSNCSCIFVTMEVF